MTTGKATVRLIDVARLSGVSLATASRALTGSDGVSKTLAAHVQQIAADAGYVANPHARSLAGGKEASIGLVVHDIGDAYFSEIASGVIRSAREHKRSVQISEAERTPASELEQVRIMRSLRVGAIIVAGSGYRDAALEKPLDEELRRYADDGGRVAVIGRHHLWVDAVLPDNVPAATTLGRHLITLGHRRIGIVAGPSELTTVYDRLLGLQRAAAEHPDVSLTIVTRPFTRDGGTDGARQLLRDDPAITAIVGLNDAMAIGVLRALRADGVPVPQRVSVAGFDNIIVAEDVDLTTVAIPMARMGALAVELTQLPTASRGRRKATGHSLVARGSTAPPPA